MSGTTLEDDKHALEPAVPEHLGLTLWRFAGPVVALNSLQVINNLLDRFFIGHLQSAALTAQSAAMNLMFLLFSLAVAIATGATAIVSRAYGAGDKVEYREAAKQSCHLAGMSGVVLAVLGFSATPWLALLVLPPSATEANRLMGSFLAVYAIGLPAIYLIQVLAGCLRGVGDSKSPMWISGLQILIHISLNTVLISGPRPIGTTGLVLPGAGWGLVGAAAALSISAWISAIIYLAYSSKTELQLKWIPKLPRWDWTQRILRIATPAGAMALLRVGSLTAFTNILTHVQTSEASIAAMGTAFALESIMFMPAFGLSMGASALVGQSLGMQKPERAERIGWIASHYGALMVLIVVMPIYFGARPIIGTMIDSKAPEVSQKGVVRAPQIDIDREISLKTETINEAVNLLKMLCLTEIMFSYAMILIGAMQGAGETVTPFWITVFSLWALRVPVAWLLAVKLDYGSRGAWISMSGTQAVQGILAMIAFKAGRWKQQKV
ncbi:MAG: MATE family efflux transporter [Armatimonadetes bacterium]|nr:MATE family efflux transporter [Armatimonadota bacterium]